MGKISDIEIRVNRTGMNTALQKIDIELRERDQAVEAVKLKSRMLYNEVMHMSRLILSQFKENAVAQGLLAAEQVISGGVTVTRIGIQAAEAFATQNWIQFATLTSLGITMAAAQTQALAAKLQAQQNEARINALNAYAEAYF